jgi:hypothetical protein
MSPAPTLMPCSGSVSLVDGTNHVSLDIPDAVDLTVTIQSSSTLLPSGGQDTIVLSRTGGTGLLPWMPIGGAATVDYTATLEDGQQCGGSLQVDVPPVAADSGLPLPRFGEGQADGLDDGGYALVTYSPPLQNNSNAEDSAIMLYRVRTGQAVALHWFTPERLPDDLSFISQEHAETSEALGPLPVVDAILEDGLFYLITQGLPPDPERDGIGRDSYLLAMRPDGAWHTEEDGTIWSRTLPTPAHHNFAIQDGVVYYPSYIVREPYTSTCQRLVTSPGIWRHSLQDDTDTPLFNGTRFLVDPSPMQRFEGAEDCDIFCDASESCSIPLQHHGMVDYLNAIGVGEGRLWGTMSGQRSNMFSFALADAETVNTGDCSPIAAYTNPLAQLWDDRCDAQELETALLSHPHYTSEDGWMLDLNRIATDDNPDRWISLTRPGEDGGADERVIVEGWDSPRHSSIQRLQGEPGWLVTVSSQGCLLVLDAQMLPTMSLCPREDNTSSLDADGLMRLRWGHALSTEALWDTQGWQHIP